MGDGNRLGDGTGLRVEWSRSSQRVRVGVARVNGQVTIRVAGELDIASVPVLSHVLYSATERPGRVVLDLSRVTFCGAAGVGLLLDAHRRAAETGGCLVVERVHSTVLRPLELCGEPEALRIARELRTAPLPAHEQHRRLSVMSQALSAVFDISGTLMGNAQLYEPAVGALRIVVQRGFHHPFLSLFETVSDRESACGVAAQDRKPVFVEEVAACPVFLGTPALDVLMEADVGAVMSVPITTWDGALIGVVSAHHRHSTVWKDEQRRALEALGLAFRLL